MANSPRLFSARPPLASPRRHAQIPAPLCAAGYYCAAGASSITGNGLCAPGAYCAAGSTTYAGAGPCPERYYCEVRGTRQLCPTGAFCPRNSTVATVCTAGFYCMGNGLAAVSGQCLAGYFCPAGSGTCRMLQSWQRHSHQNMLTVIDADRQSRRKTLLEYRIQVSIQDM